MTISIDNEQNKLDQKQQKYFAWLNDNKDAS